jgi:hypothetical protein
VCCGMSVCCTSSWTIWGGGHRCVVGCQYTVCCSTSCWTIWGGGHRCVVGCQYTVCCSTSCWTIWGGGHRFVVGCQLTVCCTTSCWTIWGGGSTHLRGPVVHGVHQVIVRRHWFLAEAPLEARLLRRRSGGRGVARRPRLALPEPVCPPPHHTHFSSGVERRDGSFRKEPLPLRAETHGIWRFRVTASAGVEEV